MAFNSGGHAMQLAVVMLVYNESGTLLLVPSVFSFSPKSSQAIRNQPV